MEHCHHQLPSRRCRRLRWIVSRSFSVLEMNESYQLDERRRSRESRLGLSSQSKHGRKCKHQQGERLIMVNDVWLMNVEEQMIDIRHEQRAPVTAFSVSELPQVQARALFSPQEHFAWVALRKSVTSSRRSDRSKSYQTQVSPVFLQQVEAAILNC